MTYVWDANACDAKGEPGCWVPVGQASLPSKQDGIIFRERVYHNLGPQPERVSSLGQLRRILKARHLVEMG